MSSDLTPRSRNHALGAARYADHWIYRCYDHRGLLLYIGCTAEVKRRIAGHRRGDGRKRASLWLSACLDTFTTEGPIRGREAAREAEAEAIWSELPLFNVASSQDPIWITRRRVADYLISEGHVELAAETTCWCEPAEPEFDIPAIVCWGHAELNGLPTEKESA